MSNTNEYVRHLGSLEGDPFEDEVCTQLGHCYTGFQRIPDTPRGDGGLDGLSHSQSRAYCCYGPERGNPAVSAVGLKKKILQKFRGDLRKLFELEHKGRELVHKESKELGTILAPGNLIKVVRLVTSYFDDHGILGPLNKSFAEYRTASQCRYVAEDAELTVWGPKEIARLTPVSDLALERAEQQALLVRVTQALDTRKMPKPPEDTSGVFEEKFDWLVTEFPEKRGRIEALKAKLEEQWTVAIQVDHELANTFVTIHQLLERARKSVATYAEMKSVTCDNPLVLLEEMDAEAERRLVDELGGRLEPQIVRRLADGEIPRLVGECPLEWRPDE